MAICVNRYALSPRRIDLKRRTRPVMPPFAKNNIGSHFHVSKDVEVRFATQWSPLNGGNRFLSRACKIFMFVSRISLAKYVDIGCK